MMNGQTDQSDEHAAAEPAQEEAVELDPSVALQAKADENWDKYVRAVAELDNYRKRSAREVEGARKFALERFGGDLLDVRDSLEMGLENAATDAEQLRAGSETTLKLLEQVMLRHGVTVVDPLGEPFDPEVHEAMMMQPSDTAEPGTIINVLQKGYQLNDRLLRAARVIVAAEA